LWHCATTRKFAVSISDGLIEIFYSLNRSPHHSRGADSAPKNEYQGFLLVVKALVRYHFHEAECIEIP
jgi:hypothetical protein